MRNICRRLAEVTRRGKLLTIEGTCELRPVCNVTLDHASTPANTFPCQQSKEVSLTTEARHRWDTRATLHWYSVALVFCCLCHHALHPAPSLTPQHTCHDVTQHSDWRCEAVYISARLALSSWPCIVKSWHAKQVRGRSAGELRWTGFQPLMYSALQFFETFVRATPTSELRPGYLQPINTLEDINTQEDRKR